MTFKVVVFTDENVVAIVSSSWLEGNSCCHWPYASSIKSRKSVQKQEEARDDWKSFPIRVPGEAGLYITMYVSAYMFLDIIII